MTYTSTSSYNRLMLIWIFRRSYRSYSYAELMLITNLCLFGTPVGDTDLTLIWNLYLTDLCLFRTLVGVTELILIQNLYLTELCLFRTPVGVTDLIFV